MEDVSQEIDANNSEREHKKREKQVKIYWKKVEAEEKEIISHFFTQ